MRGSVQAAGRKPAPNNSGKWRNWKKTQWQHSQHRWFSAELRDSWEKGPQHAVSRGCAAQSSRPRRPWWHPSPAVPPWRWCWQWGVRGWLGGRLSPLCLPVSHADLSHALASSERERLWSGSSGRRALPEPAGTGAHPLGGAPPLPPLSARDTPAAARLWPVRPRGARAVPALGICSTTLSPPRSVPARPRVTAPPAKRGRDPAAAAPGSAGEAGEQQDAGSWGWEVSGCGDSGEVSGPLGASPLPRTGSAAAGPTPFPFLLPPQPLSPLLAQMMG